MFWFSLAERLGMSVRRAQEEIDSREFTEWMARDELEMPDPERTDLRIASICCTVANAMRSKKEAYKLSEFLLDFSAGRKKISRRAPAKDIEAKLRFWLGMHKKKVANEHSIDGGSGPQGGRQSSGKGNKLLNKDVQRPGKAGTNP